MFVGERCDDLDLVPGAGDVADLCSPASKRMHGTQVLPDYVPDPTNDAIPDNIAGKYYMVYKRLHPTSDHDLDNHRPYVQLIVKTLENDKEMAMEVLEVLSLYDDVNERNLIYSMAKLISSFPVLFLGLSALLHTYCIERRTPSNSSGAHPAPLSIGERDAIPKPRALGLMTGKPSSLERNDKGLAMSTAASREREGSPFVCALRLLSDTATQQARSSEKQGQESFWLKFDEEGTESTVQWAKTENANGRRMKRPVEVPELQTAKPHGLAAPIATTFAAAPVAQMLAPSAPIATTFAAAPVAQILAPSAPVATLLTVPAVKRMVAPVAVVAQTPSKKSKKPALPVSDDVMDAALKAHTEAWKKRPAYNRWLSESEDNASNPDRCKSLFNELEKQRCELPKQIQHAHLEGSAKK